MLFKTATSRNIFSIVACGLATTVAAAGILAVIASSHLKSASLDTMKQIARDNALGIESQFHIGTTLVQNLGTTLKTMKLAGSADRERTDMLLHNLLADNAFALGVWTAWEPNAYDGKDSAFVGKPAHDATGRYMPYWVRSDGKIIKEVLVDYTKPGAGDYYIKPRENLKPVVIEPYVYPIGGKDTLITTISAPVMIDGKAQGVSGIDMALTEINTALSARKPLGDGYLALLSADGILVSHPDQSLLGKTLKDSGLNVAEWFSLLAAPETPIEIAGPGDVTSLAIAVPVKILPETTWYAVISVPKATVFATLTKVEWISAAIVIAAAIFLIAAGALLSTGFRKRLGRVIAATVAIANGKNDVPLTDLDRQDEIGDLARSLAVLRDANTQKARLEQEAERSVQERETERESQATQRADQERALQVAVRDLGTGLTRLSEGDMTVRLNTAFAGSMDQLRTDFNHSVEKLQEAMLSFNANASTIHAGSEEIRTAADAMARRTEQQAASIEQTAAALEEITTSVKDSTRRAEDASQMVNRTKQGAEHSGIVVRSAVDAMSAIERSSQEISNIIGVIDEIAFQTNLLALNAGVEAARAGEAGKGFAVVAQEVRELAQRSAKAAKEIKTLISSSGEQVRRGVDLVGQTGGALETIVSEVKDIDLNVQAIVQAAREQSTGLQEINAAVNVIDQGTQQNAAMVEESNAASHTLFAEVSALSERLSQFELGNVRNVQHAPSRPVPLRPVASVPKPAASRIAPARASAKPAPSPARALGSKLASAFGGSSATASSAAAAGSNWEEF